MIQVHIGYTATGRDRWRRFRTLAGAIAFCDRIFRTTGIVLGITVTHGRRLERRPVSKGSDHAEPLRQDDTGRV